MRQYDNNIPGLDNLAAQMRDANLDQGGGNPQPWWIQLLEIMATIGGYGLGLLFVFYVLFTAPSWITTFFVIVFSYFIAQLKRSYPWHPNLVRSTAICHPQSKITTAGLTQG